MSLKVWSTNAGILNVTEQIYFLGNDDIYYILGIDSDGVLYPAGTADDAPAGTLEIGNVDLGPYLYFGGRKLAVVMGSLTDLGAVTSPSTLINTILAKVSEPEVGPSLYMQSDSGMYHRFRMIDGFLELVSVLPEGPPAANTNSFVSTTGSVLFG